MCDGVGGTGTWSKGKSCPSDDRVAICRTDTNRTSYFKNLPFAPGHTLVEVGKLCEATVGKFAEVAKK